MTGSLSESLPKEIARIRQFTQAPLAVGFGVATREHFQTVAQAGSDGVVVGSRIVNVIRETPGGDAERAARLEEYTREVCSEEPNDGASSSKVPPTEAPEIAALPATVADIPTEAVDGNALPARFGDFGGQYVPEALVESLNELEQAHKDALADPAFWEEFRGLYGYMNRPSKLYEAKRLTEHAGGARIWLK